MKKICVSVVLIITFCIITPQIVRAESKIGLINDFNGQVRNKPTISNSGELRVLDPGEAVNIDEIIVNEYGNKWYKVSFYVNNKLETGYIYSSHITLYEYDASFETSIVQFPETYRTQLRYLHCLYPNWVFKKLDTKGDFNRDVAGFQKKALIDGSDETLRENNDVLEGKNWYRANTATTAYFLDPRNMLKAYTALMFEDLSYNETSSIDIVNKIVLDTYMNAVEEISQKTWAELFMAAGEHAKCSPNFLAIRALQEQGTKGTGGLGSQGGTSLVDLEDTTVYYNIFNIGAKSGAQQGIEYAKSKGWTTREKAINEGAYWITENYIQKNQNTLYLQRFNVDPINASQRYSHSYMSNLRGAYSEGQRTYKSYFDNDILAETKILIIPVYENMPDAVVYPGKKDIISTTKIELSPPTEPSEPVEPPKPTYPKGDVDGNNAVTAVDYTLIKNHIMGVAYLTDDRLTRADVNQDGKVSAVDYTLIKNHIMGVSSLF